MATDRETFLALVDRHGAGAPGMLRRLCGNGRDVEKALNVWFEETNFQAAQGDTVRRSWMSWTRRPVPQGDRPRHNWEEASARFRRVADALYGRPRSPGIDVISRAGTVAVAPEPTAAPGK